MMPEGEEEQQRFLGFRTSLLPWLESGKESSPADGRESQETFPLLRHPIAWVRWRIAVHRRGPYAPDFTAFRHSPRSDIT
jgi:hypothetical protein